MLLAEAKTIYGPDEVGQKFVTPSGDMVEKVNIILCWCLIQQRELFQPFRNAPLVLAEAKSVYDLYDTGNKYKVPSVNNDEKVEAKYILRCFHDKYSSRSEHPL